MKISKVNWRDIYSSEEQLLKELKQIHVPTTSYEEMLAINYYNGQKYIHSFAKQLQEGKKLSDKQITRCKRLAQEIKDAYWFTISKYSK